VRFLVTGHKGFIGTHLTNELLSQGYDVIGFDREQGDLREPGVFWHFLRNALRDEPIDYVIHLAAKVGRLFGEDNVSETITDNAGMTALIAQACGEWDVKLAYASTSEIYGDLGERMAFERGIKRLPHNIYGLSKRWGEEVAELYAPQGLVAFRFSMPYGPGLPAGVGRAAMINFLNDALERQPLTVHKGAERSWCWVGDTARGARMILEHSIASKPWKGVDAWNIGRDDIAIPMRTVAEMACAMTGAPYSLIQDVDPPGRQTVVKRLGMQKLHNLGWEPQVELAEGMERTLAWIKEGFPSIGELESRRDEH
jgi:nucleoside-diphosphate-sugar epimerase